MCTPIHTSYFWILSVCMQRVSKFHSEPVPPPHVLQAAAAATASQQQQQQQQVGAI